MTLFISSYKASTKEVEMGCWKRLVEVGGKHMLMVVQCPGQLYSRGTRLWKLKLVCEYASLEIKLKLFG